MKKNKKKIIIIGALVLIAALIILSILLFGNFNDKNSLTLEENKWIDSNKYNVIDVAVLNDIPILSYEGEGIIYNYLNYITQEQSLKFNIIPYKLDNTVNYNYKIDIVPTVADKDIVLLEDSLVLLTTDNKEYVSVNDITNKKIGIISTDKEDLTSYFAGNNVEFVEYTTYSDLKNAFTESKANMEASVSATVDGIIIPKSIYTKEIIENNYNISFHINTIKRYFVLSTNGDAQLNSIMKKYFNIWKEKYYEESYNQNLLTNYFKFKNIADAEIKKLQSKSYVYGFVDYGVYNNIDNNKISGLNELVLKDFNNFSSLSITYTKYNSISKLIKAFNSNEVDFILDVVDKSQITVDTYTTTGSFNKQLAIVSGMGNKDILDGMYSLKKKEVLTVKDSSLERLLIDNGVKVKSYNNIKDLTTDFSNSDVVLLDLDNYNYYKTSAFKTSKIDYLFDSTDKYSFIISNNDSNQIFKDLFNFYLNYNSVNKLASLNYENIAYEDSNVIYILVIIIVVLCAYIVIDFSNHVKYMLKSIKKNRQIHLTKEEKMKYIDQLTSLKNRAYLNSRIESWDESEVYPQSIIIIDLNNISYINDNYGREEGDKVITEAANILIQHQVQNSEIIRSDGNEFLIYLVGYNEKQIVSYIRKLSKELKTLSHGFGAATGYSIINDPIKTVDDAVNEATLAMKDNKEDYDY